MARKRFAFLLTMERFLKKLRAPLRLPPRSSAFKKEMLFVFDKVTDDKTAETRRARRKEMKRDREFRFAY